MVKRQREKLYNSAREQRDLASIRSGSRNFHASSSSSAFSAQAAATATSLMVQQKQRSLPFGTCALTLRPVVHPVCTIQRLEYPPQKEGVVEAGATTLATAASTTGAVGILFENSAVLPFVLKHKIDPVSGQPLQVSQLITLYMDQDEESGAWQCPILTKHLTSHMKIVAIRPAGQQGAHVYSYQAYYELNVKIRNYEDLITAQAFNPKTDVIVLNDPDNEAFHQLCSMENFYHIRHGKELGLAPSDHRNGNNSTTGTVRHSITAQRILDKLQQQKPTASSAAQDKHTSSGRIMVATSENAATENENDSQTRFPQVLASDVLGGVEHSTGHASTSFTSTSMNVHSTNEARYATEEELLQSQMNVMRHHATIKKKGYVRLHTTHGNLTLELHCDMVPRTCINFLGLCRKGHYNQTLFHRLIPGFMIQGGRAIKDKNDSSVWGEDTAFRDEFDDRLKHVGAGVVSMANSGPHSNKQQFFITFKSCPHLDRKHSIFGSVLLSSLPEEEDTSSSSLSVLKRWQEIPVNKRDEPKVEIMILRTEILEDPALEASHLEEERFKKLAASRASKTCAVPKRTASTRIEPQPSTNKVGVYLSRNDKAKNDGALQLPAIPSKRPPPPTNTTFRDFNNW